MRFATYPKYRDSGIESLGELPAHWDLLPLKRLGTISLAKPQRAQRKRRVCFDAVFLTRRREDAKLFRPLLAPTLQRGSTCRRSSVAWPDMPPERPRLLRPWPFPLGPSCFLCGLLFSTTTIGLSYG